MPEEKKQPDMIPRADAEAEIHAVHTSALARAQELRGKIREEEEKTRASEEARKAVEHELVVARGEVERLSAQESTRRDRQQIHAAALEAMRADLARTQEALGEAEKATASETGKRLAAEEARAKLEQRVMTELSAVLVRHEQDPTGLDASEILSRAVLLLDRRRDAPEAALRKELDAANKRIAQIEARS